MGPRLKKMLAITAILTGLLSGFLWPKAAVAQSAATPVTVKGVVIDNGKPVANQVVVVWCEDISHLGGSAFSDVNGHFEVTSDTDTCPLGGILSAVVYQDGDKIMGIGLAYISAQTTVNIKFGEFNPIIVPEYGQIGAIILTITGVGIALAFRRRSLSLPS